MKSNKKFRIEIVSIISQGKNVWSDRQLEKVILNVDNGKTKKQILAILEHQLLKSIEPMSIKKFQRASETVSLMRDFGEAVFDKSTLSTVRKIKANGEDTGWLSIYKNTIKIKK